ncbi:MAG: GNAT family N-acetyltransferase [Planctomycetota bacterium]
MGRPRLEQVGHAHLDALVELAREYRAEGSTSLEPLPDDPDTYLRRVRDMHAGVGLDPGHVRMTSFVLVDGERVLGTGQLRHELTPGLHRDGGHIGYAVRAGERGKGHGHDILRLLLVEARAHGLPRVLITVAETNAPSLRVAEGAGGVFDGTILSPRGPLMRRYWIELPPSESGIPPQGSGDGGIFDPDGTPGPR